MRLLVISLLTLVISGCVSRQVQSLTDLPLPAAQAGNCCWQVLQQLDIRYGEQTYKLTGALVQAKTGVTLVLLDPLGRRLLSIQKEGETLQTWRSPELPSDLPERFLLASSMLVWWPLADWQIALQQTPDWQLTSSANSRVLSHRGRAILRATYRPTHHPTYHPRPVSVVDGMTEQTVAQAETVLLQHQLQSMAITIKTERWEPLQ